jgi:hypothetical protein
MCEKLEFFKPRGETTAGLHLTEVEALLRLVTRYEAY